MNKRIKIITIILAVIVAIGAALAVILLVRQPSAEKDTTQEQSAPSNPPKDTTLNTLTDDPYTKAISDGDFAKAITELETRKVEAESKGNTQEVEDLTRRIEELKPLLPAARPKAEQAPTIYSAP